VFERPITPRPAWDAARRDRLTACSCALALALFMIASGCKKQAVATHAAASAPRPAPIGAPTASKPTDPPKFYDLIANLSECEVHHRGLSIDLGTRAAESRRGFSPGPFADVDRVDREGATFARIFDRKLTFELWVDAPWQDFFVSLRVHGGAAHGLSAYIDGQSVGSAKVAAGQTQILRLPVRHREIARGHHTLLLRFWGAHATARQHEPFIEIDWIRLATQDQSTETYAAPTLRDIVSDEALNGTPKRSLVLRAPSTVRCPLRPASDSVLRVALGFWGAGRGEAAVRILEDGEPPVTIADHKVQGGSGAVWTPLEIPLARFKDRLVSIELAALNVADGGRVMFGDPAIVHAARSQLHAPSTKIVVVVLGAGLDRHQIPPWGSIGSLSAFGELARRGVAFTNYRVPSTVPAAVLATLLSGLPPRSHTLEDPAARLPRSVKTLADLVKEASGRTAMFTSVPTSFPAFGFDHGWDAFQAFSPVDDIPAAAPYTHAVGWLDQELGKRGVRRFVLLYTRGVHPPWDLTRDEISDLKPPDYDGALGARRGGLVLGRIRRRSSRKWRRLIDQDWVRLRALETAALAKEDAALGRFIDGLKKKGAWDDALVIYAGDVGPGDPPSLPFSPAGELREDRLTVPLLVKFPDHAFAGKQITTPVTTVDIARTIANALGLRVPDFAEGADLYATAAGVQPIVGRPLLATRDRSYSTRVGSWLLDGEIERVPALCDLRVDPACVNDVLNQDPIAAQAAWQWTFDAEAAALQHRAEREPAVIDSDTAAALEVWGDIP
jgi:Sulfatase